MLLCSSKIPVTTSLSTPVFIDLAIEWILSSRNYSFDSLAWDGMPEFICTGNNREIFQIGLFENQSICVIHFSSIDNRSIKTKILIGLLLPYCTEPNITCQLFMYLAKLMGIVLLTHICWQKN